MLPQTNLQLYRLLDERGATAESLEKVGAAYEAARQLFGASFRANRKHFLCHLTGTAAALARWGERVDMVAAGLLHSAYLYGDFGDGKRGPAPSRRKWMASLVGDATEELVAAYTHAVWNRPVGELIAEANASRSLRDLTTMKLADVLDEVSDAGTAYCPQRDVHFNAHDAEIGEQDMLTVAHAIIGPVAVEDFRLAFELVARWSPPAGLQTTEKSFHVLQPGVDELRSGVVGRSLAWAGRRLGIRKVA